MIAKNRNKKICVCLMVAFIVSVLTFTGTVIGNVGGWWNQDIGSISISGSVFEENGWFTVTANGADIWGNSDEFHFVYKELSGDGHIQAYVGDMPSDSDNWAKAGVMIRQSTDPGSTHAMIGLTGGGGGGAAVQWRNDPYGDSQSQNLGEYHQDLSPAYVYLQRQGSNFYGFYWTGEEWVYIGGTQIEMIDPVLIGLCVTSHSQGQTITVPFTNISFEGNITDKQATAPSLSDGVIDDFNVDAGPFNVFAPDFIEGEEDTGFPVDEYFIVDGTGFDGELDISISLLDGIPGDGISVEIRDGSLHVSVGESANGKVFFHHDGNDDDAQFTYAAPGMGLNSLDITNGDTWDGIEIGIGKNTTPFHISIYLISNLNDYSVMTQTIQETDESSVVLFPFTDLTSNPNGGPADLENIEAIFITIGSYGGVSGPANIVLDSIRMMSDTDSKDEENIAPIPIINPLGSEIGGFVRLSAIEENNATDISYCTFSYYDGDNWIDIGTDFGTVVDSDIELGEWSAILNTSDVSPGDCRIRAYMEDDSGLYGIDEILVTVGLTPIPIVDILEYDPDLDLTVFSAGESFDPDGTITDYRWTFWTYPEIQTFTGDTINFYHPFDYKNVTFTITLVDNMNISTSITGWAAEGQIEVKYALEVQEIDHKKYMLDSVITEKQDMLSDMPVQNPGYSHLQNAIYWVDSAKEWLVLARGRLVSARNWQQLDQILEMEHLYNSRLLVDEAIDNLRNDAIPGMRRVKDITTEATLQAELEANIEELELTMIQLHGLSGKLWLLHQIGPLTHGFDISIPSVLRLATYPVSGGGTRNNSGTHYANSRAIGINYCSESIVIQPSDTDDPDVFLHELGHHFMHKKDGWSLPGGRHAYDFASNNNLAWSEGWATFYAAAKQNKSSYHDGEPGPNDDIDKNLENNTYRPGENNEWKSIPQAANVEGAISGLLWDLFDGIDTTAPENDNLNIPFKLIWMAINKSSDPTPPTTFARDIHEFYEHLMNLINNDPQFTQYKAQIPSINQVFTNHNVPKP